MTSDRASKIAALIIVLVALILLGVFYVLIWVIHELGYGFSYQDTASMPIGWYITYPLPVHLDHGQVVVFDPPKSAEALMIKNHWIHKNQKLMKKVYATPGDWVCTDCNEVEVNHHKIARVYEDYAPHKPLPHWKYCGFLPDGEYLLMSTRVAKSFDGRYFGPTKRNQIKAGAYLI